MRTTDAHGLHEQCYKIEIGGEFFIKDLDLCRPNHPCPVINCMRKPAVGRVVKVVVL